MPTSPIWRDEQMKLEDDFMWITSHEFSEMRLLIEGALNLFEDEAGVLCRLAREADKIEAMRAFNDIGTALYEFRRLSRHSKRHITRQNSTSAMNWQKSEAKTTG